MKPRARASRAAAAILALGLGGLGPPIPGAGQAADQCCFQVPSGAMKPTLFLHNAKGAL